MQFGHLRPPTHRWGPRRMRSSADMQFGHLRPPTHRWGPRRMRRMRSLQAGPAASPPSSCWPTSRLRMRPRTRCWPRCGRCGCGRALAWPRAIRTTSGRQLRRGPWCRQRSRRRRMCLRTQRLQTPCRRYGRRGRRRPRRRGQRSQQLWRHWVWTQGCWSGRRRWRGRPLRPRLVPRRRPNGGRRRQMLHMGIHWTHWRSDSCSSCVRSVGRRRERFTSWASCIGTLLAVASSSTR
mmetsp:Transcript_31433/g.104206  ORF Transcript_31433/g.104206 Transcript_31433/m.104206 type:complete len:236 (-) Transcript_31433:958-1665(-)